MKPLLILLTTFILSSVSVKLINGEWQYVFAGNLAMCCMLFFTGTAHFIFTKGMVMMIPPDIPLKKGIVYITGIMEFLFGVGLLFPQTRYPSAALLIAFFIAILAG